MKTHGILARPQKTSKGKVLSVETKAAVISFYENDEYSRTMPGKKDFVSVKSKVTGKRENVQKKLLLVNLRELFAKYKEEGNPPIGFSSFATLRPPWCILAGPHGTHSVCVCIYHQNAQLMLSAIPISTNLKDIMAKSVCSMTSEKCMMRNCKNCPGVGGILSDVEIKSSIDNFEKVEYKQWVSVDKTKLITVTDDAEEFLEKFALIFSQLTRHHYTARAQSNYLKSLKEKILPHEAIIQCDFSENYSFVVQDEVQGFHWETSQATLHPFVIYYRSPENATDLLHLSVCVVSNCREHSAASVHAYLKKLFPMIKEKLPLLKKIYYFTDGCAAQYKNKYNFINICHHNEDFGLDCEWHFFATSHGKGPCDGIGGTVKRLVSKTSLQRPYHDQILTAEAMFSFCLTAFPSITFIFVTEEDVANANSRLEERFMMAITIKGTRSFHKYVSVSKEKLSVSTLSVSEGNIVRVSTGDLGEEEPFQIPTCAVGNYISCVYEGGFWFGVIEDISEEFGDILVKFMHPKGGSSKFYHWPEKEDICWIPEENILAVIDVPSLAGTTLRAYSYKIKDDDVKKSATLLQKCH